MNHPELPPDPIEPEYGTTPPPSIPTAEYPEAGPPFTQAETSHTLRLEDGISVTIVTAPQPTQPTQEPQPVSPRERQLA